MAQPPSILVVDDEPQLRMLVARALAAEGYAVRTAEDGAQALELVRTYQPDVIVLDLMLPVLDGWTFITRYRQVADAEIPIVVVSALMDSAVAERLQRLGVRFCLAKPFDLGALLDCVAEALATTRPPPPGSQPDTGQAERGDG